jgi:hypothetical protein
VVCNVTVRSCRITGDATMLTLKLRPDTPQHYENILEDDSFKPKGVGNRSIRNVVINGRPFQLQAAAN